jgi:hypothetical protein
MVMKYLRITGFILYAYILRHILCFVFALREGIRGFKQDYKYAVEDFPGWKDGMSNTEAVKTAWKTLNKEKK